MSDPTPYEEARKLLEDLTSRLPDGDRLTDGFTVKVAHVWAMLAVADEVKELHNMFDVLLGNVNDSMEYMRVSLQRMDGTA